MNLSSTDAKLVILVFICIFKCFINLAEGGSCVLEEQEETSRPCGVCGVCKTSLSSRHVGVCDKQHLRAAGLFSKNTSRCVLVNHCKLHGNVCKNKPKRSTGICYPLFGTYRCECREGFFGRNCESHVNFEFSPKKSADKSIKHLAEVHNVVFTPIFYAKDFATVIISLLRKGSNLSVYIDSGREKLYYNEQKCGKTVAIAQFCKSLFDDVNNLKLCRGSYFSNQKKLRAHGCLITLKIPFPRSYDKNKVIHQYKDKDSSSNPIQGNLETISLGISNSYFGSLAKKRTFEYTFKMINLHNTLDPRTHCAPKVRLINCGQSMTDMPRISRYADLVVLRSVDITSTDPVCESHERFSSILEVWRVQENHDELNDLPLLTIYNTESFALNCSLLDYGIYKIRLTVICSLTNVIIPERAYGYFELVRTPLQTTILGGSMRTVFYKTYLALNVISSGVPDRYNPETGLKILYTWRCKGLSKRYCKSLTTLNISRHFQGPFEVSKTYRFTVEVKASYKFGLVKQHTETQAIKVASKELDLDILCLLNCGGSVIKSNPQEVVLLEHSLSLQTINMTFSWEYKCLEDHIDFHNVSTIQKRILKEIELNYLLIDRNVLKEGKTYVFRVFMDGAESSAEIQVETDRAPKEMVCEVFPKSGEIGKTFFTVACKSQEENNGFPSYTYELYDRYLHELVGRMIGYSRTGRIENFILTRGRLYVRYTNFFGTATEKIIKVELSSTNRDSSLSLIKLKSELKNKDYIYRMGLISAYSDVLNSRFFSSEGNQSLLNNINHEQVEDVMGALLLQNVLLTTVCGKNITIDNTTHPFDCHSILKIAKTLQQTSTNLLEILRKNSTNRRILTTTRAKTYLDSILKCSSFIIDVCFLTRHLSKDVHEHECQKKSTRNAVIAIDRLFEISLLLLKYPILLIQKYESKNVVVHVKEVPKQNSSIVGPTNIATTFIQYTVDFCVTQIAELKVNPFWWGSGNKINTNVFTFSTSCGNTTKYPDGLQHGVHLTVHTVRPLLVEGSVKQIDSKSGLEVNDEKVVVYRIDPETHSKTIIEFVNLTRNGNIKVLVIKDIRPDYDMMRSEAVEINELRNKWTLTVSDKKSGSFYYIGILPVSQVSVGESVDYSFTLFSARCAIWKYESWICGDVCDVDNRSDVKKQLLICSCKSFTLTIAGYVYVPPTVLNPYSNLSLILIPPENIVTASLLVAVFILFSIALIWTKKTDQEDRHRAKVLFLEDNGEDDSCRYLVVVFTGCRFGAGTTSKIGIRLFGEVATSRSHVFSSSRRPILQCGADDWFLLFTPQYLGKILQIQLWTDYSGRFPNWFCRKVVVIDLESRDLNTFIVEKWFGVNMKDVRLSLATQGAATDEVNTCRLIFYHNLIQGFREFHIYFSIFYKHCRSTVSRTQRLSVALVFILVSTLTTTLLYSLSTPIYEDYADYDIDSNTTVISFTGSLSGTVVSLVLMEYFRNTYATNHIRVTKNGRKTNFTKDDRHICRKITLLFSKTLHKYIVKYSERCKLTPMGHTYHENEFKKSKSSKSVPWMVCLVIVVVSTYVIIMSSLSYGEVKRLRWLTSVIISWLLSYFILIPTKILLTALLLSVLKLRYFDLLSYEDSVNKLSESFHRYEKFINGDKKLRKSRSKINLDPYLYFSYLRDARVKKLRSRIVKFVLVLYVVEAMVLISVIVSLMNFFNIYKRFHANSAICSEMLSVRMCANIAVVSVVYDKLVFNVQQFMLPKIFRTKWYNGEKLSSEDISFPETGWMFDVCSRLVGDPHLIQVRVKRGVCRVPDLMLNVTSNCLPSLSRWTVDREDYGMGWTHDNWSEIELFSESPWEFVSGPDVSFGASTPSKYPLSVGGYVATLLNSLAAATGVYNNLLDTSWIDYQTRAIVLEFVTYNANTNMITSSYFVTEKYATNFIRFGYTIRSKDLQNHRMPLQGKLLIILSLYFLIRTVVLINVMGIGNFFKSFWDSYDLIFCCLFCYTAKKYIELMYFLGREEDKAVRLRHNYLEMVFETLQGVMIQLCHSFGFATFRVLRIIHFHEKLHKYLSDLSSCTSELIMSLCLSITSMYIMFRMVMYNLEPPTVYDFMDILVFMSDFQYLQEQYDDFTGKASAFILGCLSTFGMFAFTISLLHHQKQISLRRLSLIESS